MLNVDAGEIIEKTLQHGGDAVREFYSRLAGPTRVGIEATGSTQWFLELMEELGSDCQVGHPAKIRLSLPGQAVQAACLASAILSGQKIDGAKSRMELSFATGRSSCSRYLSGSPTVIGRTPHPVAYDSCGRQHR